MASRFLPFTETDPAKSAAELATRFASDGYLFAKGLIEAQKIDLIREGTVDELKTHGFVTQDATNPIWSGKVPEGDEVLPEGPIITNIARTGMLGDLSRSPELIVLLEKVLGGEIFAWQDSDARLRIVLGPAASREGSTDAPKFSFSTPPHQDFFFFRPVRFCTVWIPLMYIDEPTGGLTLRKDAHQEGLHQTWWKGKEFLGAAETLEQAREWAKSGAVAVAGTTRPPDADQQKPWLRSNFDVGDALIIDPLMIHAGVPNHSNLVRLSADFRYQRQGTETHWESLNTMEYAGEYFSGVLECLDEYDLKPGLYENVWEKMRLSGPENSASIPERVRALVDEMQ